MSYSASTDATFLSTVEAWIVAHGEVMILIRHDASAGAKDFEFFASYQAAYGRFLGLPARTCITVFRDRQLPCRGVVDAGFITSALATVPEGKEWLVVALRRSTYGSQFWFRTSAGQGHVELCAELQDWLGIEAASGEYPPWLDDNEAVVSAVVPEASGVVVTGIY